MAKVIQPLLLSQEIFTTVRQRTGYMTRDVAGELLIQGLWYLLVNGNTTHCIIIPWRVRQRDT